VVPEDGDQGPVALIESGAFGGLCINRGCVPSKILIQTAQVAQLHVGQLRAQQLRDYLAAGAATRPEVPLREQPAGGVKPTPRLKGYCNAQVTA
jgi:hypothetical protein